MTDPSAEHVPASLAESAAPALRRHRLMSPRVVGALLLAVSAGVLGLGAWLEPDPRGFGTHRQLSMPPCGTLQLTGMPCPTCGMTTAVSLAVRGRVVASLLAQPAGAALAGLMLVGAVVGAWQLATGRNLLGRVRWRWRLLWIVLAVVLVGWGFKVLLGLASGELPIR